MKLLIITQTVNQHDPNLGFFHSWITEFASHVEALEIICLEKGVYQFPKNVTVHSLGKEEGRNVIKYLARFFPLIFRLHYDKVFVHMNPIYVVLGGFLWKLQGKKIALWYTHKSVDLKLRIAEMLADIIFSASKESFRLSSKKLLITGHGIDTEFFKPISKEVNSDVLRVLSIGRIARIKGHDTIILGVSRLKERGIPISLAIVGGAITKSDVRYREELESMILDKKLQGVVTLVGARSPEQALSYFQSADVYVNASQTGSLDKAVLEAMACGVIPLASNPALKEMFMTFDRNFIFEDGSADDLASRLEYIWKLTPKEKIGEKLRDEVVRHHSLKSLIPTLVNTLNLHI
jgi:glycosyltransferase involved in cell wall biosynthesis